MPSKKKCCEKPDIVTRKVTLKGEVYLTKICRNCEARRIMLRDYRKRDNAELMALEEKHRRSLVAIKQVFNERRLADRRYREQFCGGPHK